MNEVKRPDDFIHIGQELLWLIAANPLYHISFLERILFCYLILNPSIKFRLDLIP